MNCKKKLNTIRPTLRHKKRYVVLKINNLEPSKFESKYLYRLLSSNFKNTFGLIRQIETNITLLNINLESNELLIRVNRDYISNFISSLFFLDSSLELQVIGIYNTIKSIN